jgi:hypothetical protein
MEIYLYIYIKRDIYRVKHPASKDILAEFKDDSSKNLVDLLLTRSPTIFK